MNQAIAKGFLGVYTNSRFIMFIKNVALRSLYLGAVCFATFSQQQDTGFFIYISSPQVYRRGLPFST